MNKDLHFTNETSREDLKMFADSLPVTEIKYRGLMKAYSEYLIHEVYTDKYVMQFPKRYFSKKEKKEKTTKRRRSVDGGTTKKERKSKWTEEETKALLNGIKKFGYGNWSEIYNDNKEIFTKNNIVVSDLRIKFTRFRDLPEWRQYDPEFQN